jgi:hypothetical protein
MSRVRGGSYYPVTCLGDDQDLRVVLRLAAPLAHRHRLIEGRRVEDCNGPQIMM